MKIEGMMCGHCERAVKNALEAIDGVESAEASHEKGEAVVNLRKPVSDDALIQAVAAEEYEVLGISGDAPAQSLTKIMKIEGMMCGHCERAVKNALEAVEGVESAEASHEKGEAVIRLTKEVPDDALIQAVAAEDYEVLGVSDGQ